jgi:hypothetical protein
MIELLTHLIESIRDGLLLNLLLKELSVEDLELINCFDLLFIICEGREDLASVGMEVS